MVWNADARTIIHCASICNAVRSVARWTIAGDLTVVAGDNGDETKVADSMTELAILKGKRILAVDDEPDVLEIIREQLWNCDVTVAGDYESARRLIQDDTFDLVILDIMGVDGFALLDLLRERKLPAAMLTGKAMTVGSVNKSIRLGAISFLPKDELVRLDDLVVEILDGLDRGKSHWKRLFERLGPYFKKKLGPDWELLEKPRYPPYSY